MAYESGRGIPQDLEKAADLYAETVKKGNYFFKDYLDNIYDMTVEFKKKNPQYKKMEIEKDEYMKVKGKVML